MHSARVLFLFTLCISVALVAFESSRQFWSRAETSTTQSTFEKREAAYRANNIGVALLEQHKAGEAVASFQRALEIKPDLLIARINLAIAFYYLPDANRAKAEAQRALIQKPGAPQPHYILGLIARADNQFDEAGAEFQKVLSIDPDDAGANVNLGQILTQQKKHTEAIAAFNRAIASEPYNETALYNLGLLLTRTGKRDEGRSMLEKFQRLKQSGAGTSFGSNYLEGGRYAEAVVSTGAETELVDRRMPDLRFTDVTEAVLPPFSGLKTPDSQLLGQSGGDAALFDFDNDGDLDLVQVAASSQRLYRNERGSFVDVTSDSGDLAKEAAGVAMAVIAGDIDNDGHADLFVLRYGQSSLYHNDRMGRFSDITTASKFPSYKYLSRSVAFVDYDHEGDLDVFIGGGEDVAENLKFEDALAKNPPNHFYSFSLRSPPAAGMLVRNNGDGTFTEVTNAAGLGQPLQSGAVVPVDFDNRRDVDLLIVGRNRIQLQRNMRDGTFLDIAKQVNLAGDELTLLSSAAVGDVNKDGYPDFYFGKSEWAGYFAFSDGHGRLTLKRGPGELTVEPNSRTARHNNASQLIDLDNDGLLDLVTIVTAREDQVVLKLRVWRNLGESWIDISDTIAKNVLAKVPAVAEGPGRRLLLSGDLDGDGDIDLIFGTIAQGLRVARNDLRERNNSIAVDLRGRVSNRSAVQAKVEMRAGSLYQKLETYSASPAPAPAHLIFGLGKRDQPDAIRVTWPAGVVQAEMEFPRSAAGRFKLDITELDRKPSSCPYLYAWDGAGFEFITDFMGGGEIGFLHAPGQYNTPDPDEYVRITAAQLRPKDGRYELRVTNELEEALFVDRLQLLAVTHPIGTEVYPNEGMTATPKPFKLFVTKNPRPPASAVDDHGHDVLDLISQIDRRWPDDFKIDRIRGYAEEHALTLEIPKRSKAESREAKVALLLTGWTDYAWSSDNLAAAQGRKAAQPPSLQVKDGAGNWRTVIDEIGIPVGRPQTVTVELPERFLRESREIRIVTNMQIYWDQILVSESSEDSPTRMAKLDAVSAALRWRGYSAAASLDGREPFGYDYERVSLLSPWKLMTGRYTREGDVRELLLQPDDMFVVCRTGDEISLSFEASRLPPLPNGWTRTFLLYSHGFSKEMDINSASPDHVAPFPFHGMSRYPYRSPEQYPLDAKRQKYMEKYNTRMVTSQVPLIDTLLTKRQSPVR